ncbi:hypothetical protein AGMMS4956_01060 [Bacteroidia bacterium]|nr:hypothetical protein AGMMS4956_01060 [Bacteroidia bacterium]
MKKIYAIICGCVLCGTLWASTERSVASKEEAAQFFGSATYVVQTNESIVLDALLLDAAQKVWTATPYKVADYANFQALRTDPKNSFLLITKVADAKDKFRRKCLYVSLLVGNPKVKTDNDITEMHELGFIPLSYENTEDERNAFLLEPLLLFVQKNAENISKGMFAKKLIASFETRMRVYNDNTEQLRDKTIYVAETQIGEQTDRTKLTEQLGKNLVIVPTVADLESVVTEGKNKAVIAITIFPDNAAHGGTAYKMIVGLEGTLYYYYEEKKPKNYKFHSGDFDMWRNAYK